MREKKQVLYNVFLLLALAYTFSYVFWFRWNDGFFFLNRSLIYEKDIMEIGSMFLLNLWSRVVGFGVLQANILAWILCILSLVFPFSLLLDKRERKQYLGNLCLAVALMGAFTHNLYNPDAPTVFFLSILTAVILKYGLSNPSLIMCIGGLVGALACIRFPNIVIVPMLVLLFFLSKEKFLIKLRNALWFVLVFFVSYVLMVCLMSGRWDFSVYFSETLKESFALADDAHGIYTLFHSYVFSLFYLSWRLILLLALFLLWWRLGLFEKKSTTICFSVILLALLFLGRAEVVVGGFKELFGGLVMVLVLYGMRCRGLYMRLSIMEGLTILMFIFVPVAGSDTGLMKIYPFSIVLFLILSIRLRIFDNHRLKSLALLMPFLLFSVYAFSADFFKERKYECWSTVPNLHQFVSNRQETYFLTMLEEIRNSECEGKVLIYGSCSHILYVSLQKKLPLLMPFYMNADDPKMIEWASKAMTNDHSLVTVDFTKSQKMRGFMEKVGAKIIKEQQYCTAYSFEDETGSGNL